MKDKSIVLFVNALFAGAGKNLLFVANECKKAGWKVTIVTLNDENYMRYKQEGIGLFDLGISTDRIGWRWFALKQIRSVVKDFQPSVVCAFISDVVFMTRLATLGLNTVYVSAERGDPYTLPLKWRLPVKWAYSASDYTVFQLDGARNYFGRKVKKNTKVIPNPYSTGTIVEPYIGERKKIVVSVGRLVEQKGYDTLLKAFKIFWSTHSDYKLVIYGDGPLKEELIKEAKVLNISEHVEFPGFISNVPEAIREFAVYVLSSKFEGIPNTLIEAMSVGVPTVSTDCSPGGPRFLTDNGKRGILVPIGDAKKMAYAISNIVDDKECADTLSERGLEIINELNPEVLGKKWMEVFENCVLQEK